MASARILAPGAIRTVSRVLGLDRSSDFYRSTFELEATKPLRLRRHRPALPAVRVRELVGRTLLASCLLACGVAFGGDLLITNATLHAAPGETPLHRADILVRDGRIASVTSGRPAPSPDVARLDARGRTVTAGLWNCHVHLTDPRLRSAPQEVLTQMLLRYGFTSVVDTGSVAGDTLALRRAIAAGELLGPRIVMAGGGFVYTDGTPSYLPRGLLPELHDAASAPRSVEAVLAAGAEGVKIFTGSFRTPEHTILLPAEIIAAVTKTAHANGAFVVAHPTSRQGVVNAVMNGVDVLAHTAPPAGRFDDDLIRAIVERNVAMVPTLKLWSWELGRTGVPQFVTDAFERRGVEQVRQLHLAGGELLFGTDVGYMTDFDPRREYELLEQAGLEFGAILRMLTTNPARRFGEGETGTVRAGAPGDLVVYEDDPALSPASFSRVAYAIRGGRIVYDANHEGASRE